VVGRPQKHLVLAAETKTLNVSACTFQKDGSRRSQWLGARNGTTAERYRGRLMSYLGGMRLSLAAHGLMFLMHRSRRAA